MSCDSPLGRAVDRHGDRIALVEGPRSWTYQALGAEVDRLAGGLAEMLPAQSRVALYMHNCAEYVIAQLALERAAMVRVPINFRLSGREVGELFADAGASLVLCDSHTREAAEAALRDVDGRPTLVEKGGDAWAALATSAPLGRDESGADLDLVCSINYTSGSSGQPKGVTLSFRQWRAVYKNMLIDRGLVRDDVVAHIGPFTHAAGTYLTPFLLRGAKNVVVEGGTVDNLLVAIETHRVTGFTCVPTVLTRIISHPDLGRHDLSSLRWIAYGAEPIPANTIRRAIELFGSILTQNYGLTEAMMTCALLGPDDHVTPKGEVRLGTIGRPYSFVDLVLRDSDGKPVPDGAVGEITIRAEHVMRGYWNNQAATDAALRDGWLWTGDLARRASDGLIYLAGRSKEMIISGGFNIYPQEVENFICTHPEVDECAVVGVPDEQFGEALVAFVAPAEGAEIDIEAVRRFTRDGMGMKAPRRWQQLRRLPRTANGKVDKRSLQLWLKEGDVVG